MQRRVAAWRLRRAIRDHRAGKALDAAAIGRFRRAWGNEAFSADAAYIGEVVKRVSQCAGPILECGSGLTTLVAALVGEKRDVTIWSLEQDAEWAAIVEATLDQYAIRNVKLFFVPLKTQAGDVWYDVASVDLPLRFDLVLCDGPAVFEEWGAAHLQWRSGLLPVLASRGVTVGEVLLDDATEPRAANLLSRWVTEFGMDCTMLQAAEGDCAVLRTTHLGA